MRTISAELQLAIDAGCPIPYLKLEFTSADGLTTVDYASRNMGLELHLEPYNGYATILLRNNDHAVADIKGYWVEMVLGADTTAYGGSGNEGGTYPRMWVKNIYDISHPGTKMKVLELEDQWKNLKERDCAIASEEGPYWIARYTGGWTVFGLMQLILADAGMGLESLGTQDDGFINRFTPITNINDQPYETYEQVIYRLLIRTKCYLRSIGEGALALFKVIYPQSSDSVNETYYSYQGPWFREFAYKTKLVIPNHVQVYCNKDLEVDEDYYPVNPATYGKFLEPLMIGEKIDQDEIDKYAVGDGTNTFTCYQFEQAGDVHDQADCNFVAEAIYDRAKFESHGGRLVGPFDPRVELYDKVQVYDAR